MAKLPNLEKLDDAALDALSRSLYDERDALNQQLKLVSNERRERRLRAEGYYARRERNLADMTREELLAEIERRDNAHAIAIPDTVTLMDVVEPGIARIVR